MRALPEWFGLEELAASGVENVTAPTLMASETVFEPCAALGSKGLLNADRGGCRRARRSRKGVRPEFRGIRGLKKRVERGEGRGEGSVAPGWSGDGGSSGGHRHPALYRYRGLTFSATRELVEDDLPDAAARSRARTSGFEAVGGCVQAGLGFGRGRGTTALSRRRRGSRVSSAAFRAPGAKMSTLLQTLARSESMTTRGSARARLPDAGSQCSQAMPPAAWCPSGPSQLKTPATSRPPRIGTMCSTLMPSAATSTRQGSSFPSAFTAPST